MQENVGTIDRWVRVGVGGALVTVGLRRLAPRNFAPAALVTLGALVFESAITRVCPLNALLGIDTRVLDPRSGARRLAKPPWSTPASNSIQSRSCFKRVNAVKPTRPMNSA